LPVRLRNLPRASGSGNELQRFFVNDPAATLSIVKLFMNADFVVKGVLLLLLAASVCELGGHHRQALAAWSGEPIGARSRSKGRRRAVGSRAVGDGGPRP
jgi:hypothetical protein